MLIFKTNENKNTHIESLLEDDGVLATDVYGFPWRVKRREEKGLLCKDLPACKSLMYFSDDIQTN